MSLTVYESNNFTVQVPDHPHVDRLDGGHLIIYPKVSVKDRTKLSPTSAIELIELTMVVGEAMETALNSRGIDVARINYQDNGNWGFFNPSGPSMHMHLYGRAKSSKQQKHGEALYLPREESFYENVWPLNEEDVNEIRKVIYDLLNSDKYRHFGQAH